MARLSARQIDEEAVAWAARVDRGLSSQEKRALDAWLAEDLRRQGAYARARAIALHSARAQALGPSFDASASDDSHAVTAFTRRAVLLAGSAVAAGFIGFAAVRMTTETKEIETRKGEVQVVALDDGSVITLNTNSAISVAFSRSQRSIELVRGEALFDVAKDRDRPFVVSSGNTQAKAIGTVFSVSQVGSSPVAILVCVGLVEMRRDGTVPRAHLLKARMRGTAFGDGEVRLSLATPEDLNRELAWRHGSIAFESETLAMAAMAFARYSETRIVIDDGVIATERITGLYQANDPVGFSKAAALALNLRAEVHGGEVHITR